MALERRPGETDSEYAARQRRVKLQRQLPQQFFAHGGGGGNPGSTNVCISDIGTSGGLQGYDVGLGIGSANPNTTVNGILFYGLTWQNPIVDGEIRIRWGVAGDEQLPDTDTILITNKNQTEAFVVEWNATELCYTSLEPAYTQLLIDAVDGGETEWCFGMYFVPDLFIHYDFATLQIGEQV